MAPMKVFSVATVKVLDVNTSSTSSPPRCELQLCGELRLRGESGFTGKLGLLGEFSLHFSVATVKVLEVNTSSTSSPPRCELQLCGELRLRGESGFTGKLGLLGEFSSHGDMGLGI